MSRIKVWVAYVDVEVGRELHFSWGVATVQELSGCDARESSNETLIGAGDTRIENEVTEEGE
jgi:hypothetical protein